MFNRLSFLLNNVPQDFTESKTTQSTIEAPGPNFYCSDGKIKIAARMDVFTI